MTKHSLYHILEGENINIRIDKQNCNITEINKQNKKTITTKRKYA